MSKNNSSKDDGEGLAKEVEAAFQRFVADGGLDATHAVDEDFERTIRREVYCKHSMPKQRCAECRKAIPSYVPPNPWGG